MTHDPPRRRRPHIVLFVADDYSWHDCGPYGAAAAGVRTPNLDRLAREGMTFRYAFCTSPTCGPSRASLYTGLMPFAHGAHANHSLVRDDVRTLPHYLAPLGYRVIIAGKTHIGPRAAFPFEYLSEANVPPPGKDHVLWTDLDVGVIDRLVATHDRAVRPLCLVIGAHSPHVYWPDARGYDAATVPLPPYLLDTPETRAAAARYYTDVTHLDDQVGRVLASLEAHGYADETLFLFTADHGTQWPLAKWNLYDAGIRVPLLAWWPGRVPAGATTDALVSLVDVLPTLLDTAGERPPSELDGRSMLPLLLGGADRHRDVVFASHTGDGKMNCAPMRCARTSRYKYILNLAPQVPFTTHISEGMPDDGLDYWQSWLRRAAVGDAAAIQLVDRYRHRPPEELYDVAVDPYELRNLAADPAHSAAPRELREAVSRWRVEQGEDLSRVPMPEDARPGPPRYAG
jgi:N-sulfoglucosamine sulfohydrolase